MVHTGYTPLFVQEGPSRVRFARLQTELLNQLRSLPDGRRAYREELEAALWPGGCPNGNRLDQLIWSINRKRRGLVLCSSGIGWYVDPAARFGEYGS